MNEANLGLGITNVHSEASQRIFKRTKGEGILVAAYSSGAIPYVRDEEWLMSHLSGPP